MLLATPTAAGATTDDFSVRINEVVSNGGSPDDWIEFYNSGSLPVNLSGYIVQDDSDKNPYTFPEGTIIGAGEYLVIDTLSKSGEGDFNFGLGKGDSVRLFAPGDANGTTPILQTTWPADTHAVPSWGVRADGSWAMTAASTKGAANIFEVDGDDEGGGEGDGGEGTPGTPSGIVLNEIIYDKASGLPSGLDQVEVYNRGSEPVSLAGWWITDDKGAERVPMPLGEVVLAPGEFFMFIEDTHFSFGLGKGDEVTLHDAVGAVVDTYAYAGNAPLGTWARCADGFGDWAHATVPTPGEPNICAAPTVPGSVVLNEVDSQPADWVELYNPGTEAFDLSGYELRDNADDLDHRWAFLPGTIIAGGEFLLVEQGDLGLTEGVETEFGIFGIGSVDEIRLFNSAGELIDTTGAWASHAMIDGDAIAASYARCLDGQGTFELAFATPGAPNNCVPPTIAINEIDSQGAPDWAEIVNTGSAPVDISGWTLMDNDPAGHAADVRPLAEGTVLQPGEYFVFNGTDHFTFGLGNGDTVTIRNAQGLTVAEHVYPSHADGFWARCEDGSGDFVEVSVATPGIRNACGNPVRINEVESSGGTPGDWIELVNPTASPLDIGGVVVKDNDDSHAYTIPEGTTIPAAGYHVLEEADFGFGLGSGDSVRLFDDGQLVDSTTWPTGHADPTWGRCPDAIGPFAATAASTKGAPNVCPGEIAVSPWPGSAEVRVLDQTPTFLEDSSGLDTQETAGGTFLWLVDNGTSRIWKFAAAADGSVAPAEGWADGKRVRYQRDAANPGAAGPDSEGITVDAAGNVYLVAERDNSAKGVNQNTILQVNPEQDAADLIAVAEWDITGLLPQVGANLGAEAIEWISDAALAGKFWDQNTGAPYEAGTYAGDGLFFVAVEDGGGVFAFALGAAGSAILVSEIDPGLPGVMGLDYDTALGVLWAMCDDGCSGKTAQVTFNGTDTPTVAHFAPPAGLPNINNEGFATAPASVSVDGQRPVWWFADGYTSQALRVGTLPGGLPSDGGDNGSENGGSENGGSENGGSENGGSENGGSGVGTVTPLPGTSLTNANRGGATGSSATANPGDSITVTVGGQYAGTQVEVWMYSTPTLIASGTLNAAGSITVTIPKDAVAGDHRLAVYALDGRLLGWTDVRVGALATTGAEAPVSALVLGALLLLGGAVVVMAGRRARQL